jgi:hypothetical protein
MARNRYRPQRSGSTSARRGPPMLEEPPTSPLSEPQVIPRKLIDAFFARLWLLVIPVILAPLAVLMMTSKPPVYESTSTVWVGRSPGGVALFGDGPAWQSPAQHQATALNELLSTRRFRVGVATRTGLLTGEEASPMIGYVVSELDVSAFPIGTNLIGIRARSEFADIAAGLVHATIDEFASRFELESDRSAVAEMAYYERQLELAQSELQTRQAALDEYVRNNPEVASIGTGAGTLDFNFRTLVGQVEQQLATVSLLEERLQEVDRLVATAPQAFLSSFLVQDEAEIPVQPVAVSVFQRVGLPFAAMVFGALISAAYLYIVYRTDHTVASAEDLTGLNVPLLGIVPELKPAFGLGATFPLGTIARWRRRNFARHAASSIAEDTAALVPTVSANGRNHYG